MFERFLNPHRLTMPEIDIDIADYARSEVIDYINKKYGQNRMANIITFQTIGAKQSLRDIGRIYSINNADINNLCSLIKQPNISLDEAIKNEEKISSKNELDGPFYFLGEHAINALYTEEERKNTYSLANSINFEFNKKRGKLLNFSYNSNLPIAKFLEFMCLQSAKKRQIE